MKQIAAILISLLLPVAIFAQQDTLSTPDYYPESEPQEISSDLPDEPEIPVSTDKTRVSIGANEVIIIEENGDTTRVQLGKKGLSIIEGAEGTTINIIEMDEDEVEQREQKTKKKNFNPHYAGFEVGLNNFLNSDFNMLNQGFMNLNTEKSWNYNLNFLEYGIGFGTSYAGLVTGMGIEWSNYVFDGNNSIMKDDNGFIISRPDPFPNITKSKLSMNYLTAPLLLEFQIPAGDKRIHISGGITGGIKLWSKTKIKYQDGGRQKEVIRNDFSLAPFRYGATVRIGYRAINLFANYYFSPFFSETESAELYPFSVGLNIIPF